MGIIPGCLGESSIVRPAGESGKNLTVRANPAPVTPSAVGAECAGAEHVNRPYRKGTDPGRLLGWASLGEGVRF